MKTIAQIMNYLDGKLSGKELNDFLHLLETDPELEEQLLMHQEVDNALKDETAMRIYEKLMEAYNQYKSSGFPDEDLTHEREKPGIKKPLSRPVFKYVAAIIILTGIGIIFYVINKESYTPDQLYSMYYKPYDADIVIRSTGSDDNNEIIQGIKLYQKGKYEEAERIFSSVIQRDNGSMEAHFYKALSLIGMQQYEDAVQSLQILINDGKSAFTTHADWYLGLCYLKLNRTDMARNVLKMMGDSATHYYNAKANEMLKKMK